MAAPTTAPMTRADRRRQAKGIAKFITEKPETTAAPDSIPCGACKAPTRRQRFETSHMQPLLWHKIAPYGWLYTCPICKWRGHIVEGMSPMDDAWIQAQLQVQQGAEVEICVLAKTSRSGQPQKVWSTVLAAPTLPSGLVVAR